MRGGAPDVPAKPDIDSVWKNSKAILDIHQDESDSASLAKA
ncbi:hypothetical protein SAMN05216466_103256 [Paraburkholderia phenazinium]|uniref:Uncharacterized protein n=1 Tax=Paraburkholderia phenazinium TaxID=60549 RepID=A0A1G7U3G7_9BURK|nr:hypothetical protein SAMN05216466_103256 [Paraburkholderia phenazinium]